MTIDGLRVLWFTYGRVGQIFVILFLSTPYVLFLGAIFAHIFIRRFLPKRRPRENMK